MPSKGSMAKTGIASNNCYTLIKPFFPSGFFLKGKVTHYSIGNSELKGFLLVS